MERKMRRARQLMHAEDTEKILYEMTHGVLAVDGDDDFPYVVPLSFFYDGDAIYFHSASAGHKIDAIKKNPKVSFCVVAEDNIVPEEFTTYFRSAIVFGTAEILSDRSEIIYGLRKLAEKYSKDIDPAQEIEKCMDHVTVIRLKISSITGKESIELVRNSGPSAK